MRHWAVGAFCIVGCGLAFSIPFVALKNTKNLEKKEGALTGTQRQRGMYMNAGSSDAGIDPDWDPVERKWKGAERREKEARERIEKRKQEEESK